MKINEKLDIIIFICHESFNYTNTLGDANCSDLGRNHAVLPNYEPDTKPKHFIWVCHQFFLNE